jgi:CRISPR system Cascade subunit CasA
MVASDRTGIAFNFLTDPIIRARLISGEIGRFSLPALLVALMHDEIESFTALRPHQRHVWHAFLTQVGALALFGKGETEPAADEGHWRDILRGLTAPWPDDAPWCLVAPLDRPALLQPPVPEGSLNGFKPIVTPDELDMPITSRNHDLKINVASEGQAEDWFFALLSLQTQEGYSGSTLNGISRMNGGSSSRLGVGIEPAGGPGKRVARDIQLLLKIRDAMSRDTGIQFAANSGLGLLWLERWDGKTSVSLSQLDPFYLEICRRIRLEIRHQKICGWYIGTGTVQRVSEAKTQCGHTGDPWAPLKRKGNNVTSETVQENGLDYKTICNLIFPSMDSRIARKLAPLQKIEENEDNSNTCIVLRVSARGNSKTFGFHERRVPVSAWIRHGWTGRASDPVAKLANERVEDAGKIARGLRFALSLLAEPDRAQNERMKPQTEKAIQPWKARFDLVVDRTFFSDMEAEVAVLDDEAATQGERARWLHELHKSGQILIEDAAASLARGGLRRLRAIVRAQNTFSGSFYKAFPHLRPAKPEAAAVSEEISP